MFIISAVFLKYNFKAFQMVYNKAAWTLLKAYYAVDLL